MGRASRHKQARRAAGLSDPWARRVARQADDGHRQLLGAAQGILTGADTLAGAGSLDDGRLEVLRNTLLCSQMSWPDWAWLPWSAVGAELIGEALQRGVGVDYTYVEGAALRLCVAAAWAQAKVAVRFDAELAEAVSGTPLDEDLPGDMLLRLPWYGLYVETPTLDCDGVFVAGDPAGLRHEDVEVHRSTSRDELLMVFVRTDVASGAPIIEAQATTSLWVGSSVAGGIADMAADYKLRDARVVGGDYTIAAEITLDPNSYENHLRNVAHVEDFTGMAHPELLRLIAGKVLYINSSGADLTGARPAKQRRGSQRRIGPGVVSAGFRVGAAIRAAHRSGESLPGSGGHVAPHIRRAHWHHYWTGAHDGPRRLELRWIPPVSVNLDVGKPDVVVRRV